MYDAVVARLCVCAVAMLSGCALIGYDLGSDPESQAGRTGDGNAEAGRGTDGGAAVAGGRDGSEDGGSAARAGRGGSAGASGGSSAGSGAGAGTSETDAAIDAGAADGGGDVLLPDPCPGLADGTLCERNVFCRSEMRCSGGVCVGGIERDCSGLDQGCMHGVCIEEDRRCLAKPIEDGTDCGSDRTCLAGVCRTNQSCGSGLSCDQSCGGDDCHFDCQDADACTVACDSGSDCDVDCQDATSCAPTCNSAECDVDCRNADSCDAVCSDSDCRIRCETGGDCSAIVCAAGSTCLIECGGGNCNFQLCATNDVQQCPGDVLICNGVCP